MQCKRRQKNPGAKICTRPNDTTYQRTSERNKNDMVCSLGFLGEGSDEKSLNHSSELVKNRSAYGVSKTKGRASAMCEHRPCLADDGLHGGTGPLRVEGVGDSEGSQVSGALSRRLGVAHTDFSARRDDK